MIHYDMDGKALSLVLCLQRSGGREESLLLRPLSPVLTTAILCRVRHKCFSRKTQVSDKSALNI